MIHLRDFYRQKIDADGLSNDPAQHKALDALQALLPETNKRSILPRKKKTGRGVYLHGPVGRGKSFVMDLFFDALPDTITKRRVHFHAFMVEVHNALHTARQVQKKADGPERALIDFAQKTAREVQVLCFDEFHVIDVADAMILSRLFTAMLDSGLIVVMTSNWPPEKLYEGGLQRDRFLPFIDLIKRSFAVVAVDGGTDYRLRKLEETGVYRHPLGPAARDWADALFTELSAGAPPENIVLNVKGREITVPMAARGVARFHFSDLCEKPVGAEDYLEIARTFHTVFLESVPKLRYDRRNEAKRLMILVDTLYDCKARLIITADAPPEKLYYGDDHAFEFQRTVSRLLEMQSNDWLEKTEIRQQDNV